jgi:hypothetical protein
MLFYTHEFKLQLFHYHNQEFMSFGTLHISVNYDLCFSQLNTPLKLCIKSTVHKSSFFASYRIPRVPKSLTGNTILYRD